MSVKEFVYLIQNHADLHKLYVQFSHQISFMYFKFLKNTNVLIKTFHKPFTTFVSVLFVCVGVMYSGAYVCDVTLSVHPHRVVSDIQLEPKAKVLSTKLSTMIFNICCVGAMYSGKCDACDVTLSVYPHRRLEKYA